jgi:hypothetical protein
VIVPIEVPLPTIPVIAEISKKLHALQTLGRWVDALQIIILATMGQYLYGGGSQKLNAPHWKPSRDFLGGYQHIGISLMIISLIGFAGLFSLAVTKTDRVYNVLMWLFSGSAGVWFIGIGIAQGWASNNIPGAGSTGLWTLGLSGLFFLFSRAAIWIASGIVSSIDKIKEPHARPVA